MGRFSDEILDHLFDAVLVDDVVRENSESPPPVPPILYAGCVRDCFDLCHELWSRQVRREDMVRLADQLILTARLDAKAALDYKYIRAKFKHLRFAFMLYTTAHRSPRLFKHLTIAMGHLQDGFRNGSRFRTRFYALQVRIMTSRPVWALMLWQVRRLRLVDEKSFERYVRSQISSISASITKTEVTGHEYHTLRKMISQNISFLDTYRSLVPNADVDRISGYLSDINGRMGRHHDELVLRDIQGEQNYNKEKFPLDGELVDKIRNVVTAYRNF